MSWSRRPHSGRYGARADLLSAGPVSDLLDDGSLLDVLPEDGEEYVQDYVEHYDDHEGHGGGSDGPGHQLGDDGQDAVALLAAEQDAVPLLPPGAGDVLMSLPPGMSDLPVPVRLVGEAHAQVGVVDLEQLPRHQHRWLTRGARKVTPEPSARGDAARIAAAAGAAAATALATTPTSPDQPLGLVDLLQVDPTGATSSEVPPFAAPPAPRVSQEDPPARGRRGRRGSAAPGEPEPGVMELPTPQGYVLRRSARKARRGWYAPVAAPSLTSTRQASILNPALVAAPTTAEGILIGRDRLSNTPVAHDPFTAYENRTITSPAVVVLGVIGAGKSSLLKTVYVLRPLILRNRRAVVMDRKDRGGEGEYCETSRQLGAEPLRFVIGGGGTRLNILDPVVLAGSGEGDRGVAGQARLLIALAELANDGEGLDKWEKSALRFAHKAALRQAEADQTVPVLEHLLHHLGRVVDIIEGREVVLADFIDYSRPALERMHQAGLGVRHLISALLSDELSGLFDGPTSKDVRLAAKLTNFDVSQLPDEGPAVSMVMAVANVWLLGTLRRHRGLQTNFIAEEGWDLVGGPGGRVFQRNSKLARGLGLSNIAALHHVADIPPHDPAVAMLKEAQTVHLYRQDREDDIDAVIRLYGLDQGSRGTLPNLSDGHHLLKIGNRREIHVEHVRSRMETGLTNTDEAMVTAGRLRTLVGAR